MNRMSIIAFLLMVQVVLAAPKPDLSAWEDIPTETGPKGRCAMEIMPSGLVYMVGAPGRPVSMHCQVAGILSVRAEPLVGIGVVTGYGGSFGFLIGDPAQLFDGHRFGLRYVFHTVEGTDPVHEFFVQWIRTYSIRSSWIWHYGGALGLGATKYQERDDYDEPTVESGLTYRLEIGVGYILF